MVLLMERIVRILPLSVNFVVILPLIQGGEDGLLAARPPAAVPRGAGPHPPAAAEEPRGQDEAGQDHAVVSRRGEHDAGPVKSGHQFNVKVMPPN